MNGIPFLLFALVSFIWGLLYIIKPDLPVMFQVWTMKILYGYKVSPSKQTYSSYRFWGICMIILSLALVFADHYKIYFIQTLVKSP